MTYFGHDTLLSGWRWIASTLSPGLSAGIKKDLQSLGEGPLQQVLKNRYSKASKACGVVRQVLGSVQDIGVRTWSPAGGADFAMLRGKLQGLPDDCNAHGNSLKTLASKALKRLCAL